MWLAGMSFGFPPVLELSGVGWLNSPPRELVDPPSSPFSSGMGQLNLYAHFSAWSITLPTCTNYIYCATVTNASDCTRIIRRTGNAMCPDSHAQKVCIESMHLVKVYMQPHHDHSGLYIRQLRCSPGQDHSQQHEAEAVASSNNYHSLY